MGGSPTSSSGTHLAPATTGQSASLAALAVSLADAPDDDRTRTRELLADRPAARELHAARSLLRRWRLDDPQRQHRAVLLIDRAIAQTTVTEASAVDAHRWVTEWSS